MMKKLLAILAFGFVLQACGDSDNEATMEDPGTVQPPADAIPDSMTIVNDSVITPQNKPHLNGSDTMR